MPIGQRIHVIGNSASGKSTLAASLAESLDAAFVELDALNWLPGWVGLNETNPDEFERRIREATMGERWVVAVPTRSSPSGPSGRASIPSSGSICRCGSFSGEPSAARGSVGDPGS